MNSRLKETIPPGYPRAMGNEEETGLLFKLHGYEDWVELDRFTHDLFDFRFDEVDRQSGKEYLVNGMRFYSGLSDSSLTNPERATPECSTLEQASSLWLIISVSTLIITIMKT